MKQVKVQAETRSANLSFKIANTCYEMARRATEDWEKQHHCLVGIIFVAFATESMLNHYARILFQDWEERKKRKTPRKEWHMEFFVKVNLSGYLGRKAYQTINECLEIRDSVAHGGTLDEEIHIDSENGLSRETLALEILFASAGLAKQATLNKLAEYIDALNEIERDIEKNGYYPESENISNQVREKLCESPLSVSGIRSW